MNTMAGNDLLILDTVCKSYKTSSRAVEVLQDFSMTLKQGESLAIIGPSGCGKSTLLRLIMGLERPDAGVIAFNSSPITGPSPERCLVFQEHRLLPWLTIRGNIDIAGNGKDSQIDKLLDIVGLRGLNAEYPSELSGGMAKRVSLARALISEPKLLLLDEPFGALDISTRWDLQDKLLDWVDEKGSSILIVTHDLSEAVYCADRILLMSREPGRYLSVQTPGKGRPRISSEHIETLAAVQNMVEPVTSGKAG